MQSLLNPRILGLPGLLGLVTCVVLAACSAEPATSSGADESDAKVGSDAAIDAGVGADAGNADATAATDAGPPATAGEFKALTYNVKGLPAFVTGWDTLGHMKAIAPLLEPYDLIGMQEDFVEENHKALVAVATHPTKDWFSAKKASDKGYGSGLSVLARMPVVTKGHEHFASCVGVFDHASDCLASKGVMFMRLRLSAHPDATVDVYNTHMEAGGGTEDEAVRAEQVQHILKMIDTHSKGRAVLFMGDTNLHPHQALDKAEIDKLDKGAGLVDSCTATKCAEPKHIDRFHFRSGSKLELVAKAWSRETGFVDEKGEDLSDHPAISTVFTWQVK